MKSVVCRLHGPPEVLEAAEAPEPEITAAPEKNAASKPDNRVLPSN